MKFLFLFIAYYATAKVGLALDPVSGYATSVWPPSGIALASLLLFGTRLWPAVSLGAFLINLGHGAPWYTALGMAAGNTLEAVVGVYLLRNFTSFRDSFERLSDVVNFTFAAVVVSTMIAATLGSLSMLSGGLITQAEFQKTWLAWFTGDALGDLIIAPFLLLWLRKTNLRLNIRKSLETTVLILLLILISLVIFRGLFGINVPALPINYLLYVPLIFIALRLTPKENALAIVILAAIAVWGTTDSYGIFATTKLSESLLLLQTFIGATTLTFFTLSVLMQEKREADRRKDEFLAIASHELKTPLTTAKVYIDILKRRFNNKSANMRYVKVIDEQTLKLTKLINDMLDITKISSGKIVLGPEDFNFEEFLRSNVKQLQKLSRKHKINFSAKGTSIVHADKYKISQVVTNLISNAIKYSLEGEKIIVRVTSNKRFVTVSVQDFGPGIDKKYQRDVFKRFFQLRTGVESQKPGLGLGLFISYEIIKKHNGRMWIKSSLGKGTTFFFTLPKAKPS